MKESNRKTRSPSLPSSTMEPPLGLAQWAQGQSNADRGPGNAPSAFSPRAHCYRFPHSLIIVVK